MSGIAYGFTSEDDRRTGLQTRKINGAGSRSVDVGQEDVGAGCDGRGDRGVFGHRAGRASVARDRALHRYGGLGGRRRCYRGRHRHTNGSGLEGGRRRRGSSGCDRRRLALERFSGWGTMVAVVHGYSRYSPGCWRWLLRSMREKIHQLYPGSCKHSTSVWSCSRSWRGKHPARRSWQSPN